MSVTHQYVTSYKSKTDLLNFIKTSEFLLKNVDMLGEEDYRFEPDITKEKYIKWPVSLLYKGIPKSLPFLAGMQIPETSIESKFRLEDDELFCDTTINFSGMVLCFKLKLTIADAGEFQKIIIS